LWFSLAKIEVVVFYVVAPCGVVIGYQRCGGCAASIFWIEVHGEQKVDIDICRV
jgi:hypothetical protein